MARKATGQVLERPAKSGGVTFALRFRAYGRREYLTLGTKSEGWTRQQGRGRAAPYALRCMSAVWAAGRGPSR